MFIAFLKYGPAEQTLIIEPVWELVLCLVIIR